MQQEHIAASNRFLNLHINLSIRKSLDPNRTQWQPKMICNLSGEALQNVLESERKHCEMRSYMLTMGSYRISCAGEQLELGASTHRRRDAVVAISNREPATIMATERRDSSI